MDITCKHNMAERDTAIADGYCPICDAERIAELEAELTSCKKATDQLMKIWPERYQRAEVELAELRMQYERLEADNQRLHETLYNGGLRDIINEVYGLSNGKEYMVERKLYEALNGGDGDGT